MPFALNHKMVPTEKFPTDEDNYIIGKALHKTVAVPQLIQQTIRHHILE
jgi:hypothetical protein